MNVIFLDFDGVLTTIHDRDDTNLENRIKLLSDLCKEFDCKVVIEAGAKNRIDYYTNEIIYDEEDEDNFVKKVFDLFDKYKIDCIGRTPNVVLNDGNGMFYDMNKQEEIRLYLFRHPEIDHYCIIDDDDLKNGESDLKKVKDHLLKTIYYSRNPEEEGLLPQHKEEFAKIIKKDNDIKSYALRKTTKEREAE